jgi:hypothetical protein
MFMFMFRFMLLQIFLTLYTLRKFELGTRYGQFYGDGMKLANLGVGAVPLLLARLQSISCFALNCSGGCIVHTVPCYHEQKEGLRQQGYEIDTAFN